MRKDISTTFFAMALIIWGSVLLDHVFGGARHFPTIAGLMQAIGLGGSPPWAWAAEAWRVIGQLDAGAGALVLGLITRYRSAGRSLGHGRG